MMGPTNANPRNTVMTPAASTTVGSDIRPIKIVNGVATAVANDLALDNAVVHLNGVAQVINSELSVTTPTPASALVRNIILSTNAPTSADGNNGDVWIQY